MNTLAQAKTFFRWMTARGWLKHPDALKDIEVLGRRKKGKPQLTEDESGPRSVGGRGCNCHGNGAGAGDANE